MSSLLKKALTKRNKQALEEGRSFSANSDNNNNSLPLSEEVGNSSGYSLRRASFLNSGRSSGDSSFATSLRPAFKDIQNHFGDCIKLFTENKINVKNVWDLKIIDYISTMARRLDDPIKTGGMGLGVVAKVYGIRVDNIYADGLKLAESVAKRNAGETKETHYNSRQRGKGRKEKPEKVTVVKDVKCLLQPLQKLQNVYFQSTHDFNGSMCENFSTNTIPMDWSQLKFMLKSAKKFWPDENCTDECSTRNSKKHFRALPLSFSEKICLQLEEFEINRPELIIQDEINVDVQQPWFSENDVELDGPVHDDNLEVPPDSDDDLREFLHPDLTMLTDLSFSKMKAVLLQNKVENMISGPSHWKLKIVKPERSRFSGERFNKRQQKRTYRKRKLAEDDYIDMWTGNEAGTIDVSEKLLITRLPKRTNARPIPLISPRVKKFFERIFENETRPGTFVKMRRVVGAKRGFLSRSEIAVTSDEDAPESCPADDNTFDEEIHFNQENYVRAPENVVSIENLSLPAMKPKTINMKKLQTAIWELMKGSEAAENIALTFSHLYEEVPSHLTEMKNRLTMPVVFGVVLHIASDRGLRLIGDDDLKDFTILGS